MLCSAQRHLYSSNLHFFMTMKCITGLCERGKYLVNVLLSSLCGLQSLRRIAQQRKHNILYSQTAFRRKDLPKRSSQVSLAVETSMMCGPLKHFSSTLCTNLCVKREWKLNALYVEWTLHAYLLAVLFPDSLLPFLLW